MDTVGNDARFRSFRRRKEGCVNIRSAEDTTGFGPVERLESIMRLDSRSARELSDLESVILGAQLSDDDELEFRARAQWTVTSNVHPRPQSVRIQNLEWCLRWIDAHRSRVHDSCLVKVLWDMKARIQEMSLDPSTPMTRVHAMLDDYRRHLEATGRSMESLHALRMQLDIEIGAVDSAQREQALRDASPRDDLSDCTACQVTGDLRLDLIGQRYVEAADRARAFISGHDHRCPNQPHEAQAASLHVLTRVGDEKTARRHALDCWSVLVDKRANPVSAGTAIHWAAWSGAIERALMMIDEYLPGFDDTRAQLPGYRIYLLAGSAYALERAVAAGLGRHPLNAGTVAALAQQWSDEARDIAAAFDRRNRTPTATLRIEEMLHLPPLR